MTVNDDTQPRSPFRDQPPGHFIDPEEPARGPGCLIWGLVAILSLACGLIIVVLAATAGWSEGRRIAYMTSTAEIRVTVDSQLTRIPQDIASGNYFMLDRRIQYLETLLPNMPGLSELAQTATSVYLNSLPTATAMPSDTPTPSPTVAITAVETTAAPAAETTSPYDLDGLLGEARASMTSGAWADAIDTLDVILAIDPNYQQATISGLMLEALRSEARRLYNEEKLAEAMLLTNRAEEFGLSADDPLRYERYVAGLYLDAVRAVGTDYQTAINSLREIYDLGSGGRYYAEVRTLLISQYVAYGDAWVAEENYCMAAPQYQASLALQGNAAVDAKLSGAQTRCLQLTTTPGEGAPTDSGGQSIAPVGVPGS